METIKLKLPREVRDITLANMFDGAQLFSKDDDYIKSILISRDRTQMQFSRANLLMSHDQKHYKASIYDEDTVLCDGSLEYSGKSPSRITKIAENNIDNFKALLNIAHGFNKALKSIYSVRCGLRLNRDLKIYGELFDKYVTAPARRGLEALSQSNVRSSDKVRKEDGTLDSYMIDDDIEPVPLLLDSFMDGPNHWTKNIDPYVHLKFDFKLW